MEKKEVTSVLCGTILGMFLMTSWVLWAAHRDSQMFHETCEKYELYC